MSKRQITIRMPKDSLAKWLKALRKGGYTQGRGALYIPGEQSFCCLGVLQHCLSRGRVEDSSKSPFDGLNGYATTPSMDWLKSKGIEFYSRTGMRGEVPFIPIFNCGVADANDYEGKTFAQIADAMEACAEGF